MVDWQGRFGGPYCLHVHFTPALFDLLNRTSRATRNLRNSFNVLLTVHLSVTLVTSSLSTCIPDGHLQRVTIPDAVLVQFDLLMMSTTLLETCRGL